MVAVVVAVASFEFGKTPLTAVAVVTSFQAGVTSLKVVVVPEAS